MVNGYLVVSSSEPGAVYKGLDRSPWSQVDAEFYGGTLPSQLRTEYDSLRSDQSRGLWWPTCTDLGIAMMFAEYSRRASKGAEVIAIWSPYLAHSQGREGWHEPRAHFLGVDVVAVGEWSLLKALLGSRDQDCKRSMDSVNASGLLRDAARAPSLEARYRELSQANVVEPIADPESGISVEAVMIYALGEEGDYE